MSQGINVQFVDPQGFARQLQGQFIAGKYAAVTLNSASGTTPQTVLTAPAGQYAFIWGVQITTDVISTISAAGMLNTTLTTVSGGETVALLRSYFPSTPASPDPTYGIASNERSGRFLRVFKGRGYHPMRE